MAPLPSSVRFDVHQVASTSSVTSSAVGLKKTVVGGLSQHQTAEKAMCGK
jgi:hypothetical protein